MTSLDIQTTAASTLSWIREEDSNGAPDFLNGSNDTTPKPFGRDESISGVDLGQEDEEYYDWATRDVDDHLVVGYNPSFTVEVTAANWWILELIVSQFQAPVGNDPDGDGTNENYTYTTDGAEDPFTFQVTIGNTKSGEDYVIEGCRVNEAEISTEGDVGGDSGSPVDVSLSINGATVRRTEPTTQVSEPAPLEQALSFGNTKVDFARTNNYVITEVGLTITNNEQGIKQIRNNVGNEGGITDTAFFWGSRNLEIDHVELRSENADEAFKRVLGSSGNDLDTVSSADKPNATITIGNTILAGPGSTQPADTDVNEAVFSLSNLFPTDFSWDNFTNPDEAIEESMMDIPNDITVDYTAGDSSKV